MVTASPEERRLVRREHLGAVFQDPMTSLNPTMRVGRQVEEAAESADEALRLLEAVGVPEAKRRLRAYPHELSGGLRQRVMIAMAVAGSPSLVVADEPTTALDVTVQSQILELIRSLRDEFGTSFILVTHDLGVAAQVADRIAVLYGSRFAEIGDASGVLSQPVHPYTSGLLRSRLILGCDRSRPIMTLRGEPPDPRAHPPGCPFGPRCDFHVEACDAEGSRHTGDGRRAGTRGASRGLCPLARCGEHHGRTRRGAAVAPDGARGQGWPASGCADPRCLQELRHRDDVQPPAPPSPEGSHARGQQGRGGGSRR